MSNSYGVYKSSFIQMAKRDYRVIDSNALVAKRVEGYTQVLRERENPEGNQETDEEGNPLSDSVDMLTGDVPEGGFEPLKPEAVEAPHEPTLEEIKASGEEIIANAKEEAARIIEEAKSQVASIKEEAREDGYADGKGEALAELEEAKRALEEEKDNLRAEFENQVKNIEPDMIDVITDVYKHVFSENFYSRKDVLACLINKALLHVEPDERIAIYVSAQDYDFIIDMKDELIAKTGIQKDPEFVQREDFYKGQAKIETSMGIIDCSIDTELTELTRAIKLLSYEGRNDG